MNIFNLLPIMLHKTAVLGVGASGILLTVLGCTGGRPMNNLEKRSILDYRNYSFNNNILSEWIF